MEVVFLGVQLGYAGARTTSLSMGITVAAGKGHELQKAVKNLAQVPEFSGYSNQRRRKVD